MATEKTRNSLAIGAKFLPALRSVCLFVPGFPRAGKLIQIFCLLVTEDANHFRADTLTVPSDSRIHNQKQLTTQFQCFFTSSNRSQIFHHVGVYSFTR